MDTVNQLIQVSMDCGDQLAWSAIAVGITMTASLILFGIWRRGYWGIEATGGTRIRLHNEGIKWMFLACTLWCLAAIMKAVSLFLAGSLRLDRPALTFISVVLSLANSLCFVLATANLDATMADSSAPAKFLQRIRCNNPYLILTSLISAATVLYFVDSAGKYVKGFDALVTFVTIFLITWGFFKSFWKRGFPLVAALSIVVFFIFGVAQSAEFFDVVAPNLLLARRQFLEMALSVGADGMASLLFIALAFSSVHEQTEELTDIFIENIPSPSFREIQSS